MTVLRYATKWCLMNADHVDYPFVLGELVTATRRHLAWESGVLVYSISIAWEVCGELNESVVSQLDNSHPMESQELTVPYVATW